MDNPEYSRRFQAALAKAFAANDGKVRIAYFELADFYHRKLRSPSAMYPPAALLRDATISLAAN